MVTNYKNKKLRIFEADLFPGIADEFWADIFSKQKRISNIYRRWFIIFKRSSV